MYNADPNAPPPLIPQEDRQLVDDLLREISLAAEDARVLLRAENVDYLYAHIMAIGSAGSILGKLSAAACKAQYMRDIPLFKLSQDVHEEQERLANPFGAMMVDFSDTDGEPGEDDGTGQYL